MRRRQYLLGALAVGALALALRLGPLYWSPLPFNPDGILYAGQSRATLSAGSIGLDGTATDELGFTALLVSVARATGIEPLYVAQPASALIGASAPLFAVGLTRRVAGRWLSPGRARRAALLAGSLLAVQGLYLYRSMATDEQTLGLLVVPLLVVAVRRWLRTGDRRLGAVALALGLVLPPIDNLSGFVAALATTFVLVLWVLARPTIRRSVAAVLGAGTVWTVAVGYHVALAELTPAVVVQAERVTRAPGLLVPWVVLVAVGVVWFVTTSGRWRGGVLVGVVATWFGLLAINVARTVFPGTATTPPAVLLALAPLAVPGTVAVLGLARLAEADGDERALVALVAGPVALIGFSLSAGLTFEYLATIFRAQLFVHLPLAACCGIAATLLLVGDRDFLPPWGLPVASKATESVPGSGLVREAIRVGVPAVLVVCAAASVPVAFADLSLLTYEGTTTQAEFAATTFADEEVGEFGTDDHLARVAVYHRRASPDRATATPRRDPANATRVRTGAPRRDVLRWIVEGGPPPDGVVVSQDSWTTTGAQAYPRPPVRIERERYRRWLATSDVVYAADAGDTLHVVVSARPGDVGANETRRIEGWSIPGG